VVQPSEEAHPSRPIARSGDIAAEVIQDAQRLFTLEIALAKQEIKDIVVANAIAAGMVASGGVLTMLCVLVAVPFLVVTLVPWKWQAAVAWVILYALLGIGLLLLGTRRFEVRLPAKTLASLKENKEWALRQMKSTVR
jgi:hypothetical protein